MLQDSGEDNGDSASKPAFILLGLSMMLNVQQNEYLETLEMAALKIFVHPYNQLIFRESLSFNAMPGASSTLKVSKSTYVSLGGSKTGTCFLMDVFLRSRGVRTDFKRCRNLLLHRELLR